jgi:SAM-dependent methyltransferase
MENRSLDEISELMISRYSKRYKELGYDVKTLGWGSKEQQVYRFEQTLPALGETEGKTLIDIGCGFGDYYAFLFAENQKLEKYYGWDINPDLIEEATRIWEKDPKANFETVNISSPVSPAVVADKVVMLGVLNLNLEGRMDNYNYSFKLIQNAFACAGEVLVVDFLSNKLFEGYPKEDFVFYHDPAKMLEFALSLSPNVLLNHDYAPIPQKEFMLFLYK